MSDNTTQPTAVAVADFLGAVEPETKRRDALALDRLFRDVTGWQPVMWGPSIVGYGSYDYETRDGRRHRFLATGFAPRKAALSLYIMPGYQDFGPLLERLGKHSHGKACLYVKKLADVDQAVLAELIRAGLDGLGRRHTIHAS